MYGRIHATSRAAPSIVIGRGVVAFMLLLLFHRQFEEGFRQGELLLHLLLAQTIVLHVEESNVMNSMFELLCETLFATWTIEVLEIKRYRFCPIQRLFGLGWLLVGCEVALVVLLRVRGRTCQGVLRLERFCGSLSFTVAGLPFGTTCPRVLPSRAVFQRTVLGTSYATRWCNTALTLRHLRLTIHESDHRKCRMEKQL